MSIQRMKIRDVFLTLLFVTAGAITCGPTSKSPQDGGEKPTEDGPSDLSLVAKTESIQKEVADKYCTKCHGDNGTKNGVDLTELSKLILTKNRFIVGKNPEGSEFYKQIVSGKMPKYSDKLPDEIITIVRDWIMSMDEGDSGDEDHDHETNHEEGEDDDHEEGEDDDHEEEELPDLNIESNLISIQAWVNRNCVSCHDVSEEDNRNVDLRNITSIIMTNTDDPSSGEGRKIIKPGFPYERNFYNSMDPEFTPDPEKRMPKDENTIPEEVLAKIRKWIEDMEPLVEIDPCDEDPDSPDCEDL